MITRSGLPNTASATEAGQPRRRSSSGVVVGTPPSLGSDASKPFRRMIPVPITCGRRRFLHARTTTLDVRLIECAKIRFPKSSKYLRPFNREFAYALAQVIRVEGMYSPIVMRPDPAKPGNYLGVLGRHRFYAKQKVLKERYIEANVISGMSNAAAEMAMLSDVCVIQTPSCTPWYDLLDPLRPRQGDPPCRPSPAASL
jgi:hypothetical protein